MGPHDSTLIDALETRAAEAFAGPVWRVTRAGRDALYGSTAPGRWSPGDDARVLYTSLERDGALAEIGFRLSLEPVWPSRIAHEVHRIEARTGRTLRFADVAALVPLGVDPARWTGFDYTATRAIAAAAHFLEFDGLIVPSARADCANLVVFLDNLPADRRLRIEETAPVDWAAWRGRGFVIGS
jgi:hypothetical protein